LTSPPQADGTAKSTKINARDTEIALFVEQPILFCKPLVDMVKKLTIPRKRAGNQTLARLWRARPPIIVPYGIISGGLIRLWRTCPPPAE